MLDNHSINTNCPGMDPYACWFGRGWREAPLYIDSKKLHNISRDRSMKIRILVLLFVVAQAISGCAYIGEISDRVKASIRDNQLINSGRYDEAEVLFKEEFQKRPDIYGEKLASLYIVTGRYEEALPYLKNLTESVEYEYLIDPKKVPLLASRLNYLGEAYLAIGYYPEAESMFKRTLPGIELLGKQKKRDALDLLADLIKTSLSAKNVVDTGKYDSEWQNKLNASVLINSNVDEQRILENLAIVYVKTGRLLEANSIYESITDSKKISPSPVTLVRYGELLHRLGRSKAAKNIFRQALEESEKAYKDKLIAADVLARVLVGVAYYNASTGETELMHKYTNELLELLKISEFEHPDYAELYLRLGQIYQVQGNYEASGSYMQKSLSLEKRKGKNHLEIAHIYRSLSNIHAQAKQLPKSLDYLRRSLEIEEYAISRNISVGSDKQKQAFIGSLAQSTDLAVSFHLQSQPFNDDAFNLAFSTILSRKGRVLDALSYDQKSGKPDNVADLDYVTSTLSAIRAELTKRAFTNSDSIKTTRLTTFKKVMFSVIEFVSKASPSSKITVSRKNGNEPNKIDIDKTPTGDLEKFAELLQDTLARRSTIPDHIKTPTTIEDVAFQLPENAVLIEYVLYTPHTVTKIDSETPDTSLRYAAYIVNDDGEKNSIDLGDAHVVDEAIKKFYVALENRSSSVKSLSRQLDQLIAQPIRKIIEQRQNLLISPDSLLNMIPFEALWTEDNEYMIESYTISYLSGGRELLKPLRKSQLGASPVIFANPDYQLKLGEPLSSDGIPNEVAKLAEWCCDYLPGTEDEARRLKEILPDADIFTEKNASKEMLATINSPSVLHVASHGFFIGEDFSIKNETSQVSEASRLNPLLKSGIALAGFNPSAGYYNGVMTAFEAAGLDLEGTSLVVLSACRTGVGDIQVGEGVLGLRRSFSIAGAASLVFSLWDVADKETADLMVDFYRNVIAGSGKAEALKLAKLKMLLNPNTSHPFFWSAFILSGDRSAL